MAIALLLAVVLAQPAGNAWAAQDDDVSVPGGSMVIVVVIPAHGSPTTASPQPSAHGAVPGRLPGTGLTLASPLLFAVGGAGAVAVGAALASARRRRRL